MIVGVWMSFIELTQFYITNWLKAPFVGIHNYTVALDFSNPLGSSSPVLRSHPACFTILTVGFSWLFGMAASIVLQKSSADAGRFGRSS